MAWDCSCHTFSLSSPTYGPLFFFLFLHPVLTVRDWQLIDQLPEIPLGFPGGGTMLPHRERMYVISFYNKNKDCLNSLLFQ